MAVNRSDRQKREMGEFVLALFRRSGAGTQAELAREARVHTVQLSQWMAGKAVPDGYNLLLLMRASERMAAENAAGDHPARGEAESELRGGSLDDRLARLEGQVDQLARAETVELGFRALEAAILQLAQQREDPTAQTP